MAIITCPTISTKAFIAQRWVSKHCGILSQHGFLQAGANLYISIDILSPVKQTPEDL
jgi:hypothetical protein